MPIKIFTVAMLSGSYNILEKILLLPPKLSLMKKSTALHKDIS